MRKTIKKVGDSRGIIFNIEECSNFNLNLGDVIEFDIKKIKKVKNEKVKM